MIGIAETGLEALVAFAKAHPELMAELIDLVEGRKLTEAQVTDALRAAMIAASDTAMRAELGLPQS